MVLWAWSSWAEVAFSNCGNGALEERALRLCRQRILFAGKSETSWSFHFLGCTCSGSQIPKVLEVLGAKTCFGRRVDELPLR